MIQVQPGNATATNPIVFTLQDQSGAHVTLTACIKGQPPLSHSFSYNAGTFSATAPALPPGIYQCFFAVQAFQYAALSKMYDCSLFINGNLEAHVNGNIPDGATFDSGYGLFNLTIH